MTGSHFRKTTQFKTDYSPSVITKYESQRTGMSSVVVDCKGPKVLGFFALATEILDDSGAPHTLEHLCFMGSKNYGYKGVLDRMANRAYSGTNAWTATDHTAYTLETAGWEGFAQILPVYLEHILLPTLTDSGCYTEVHHIDGSGQDAGVVYSEMQGVQNTSDTIVELKAARTIYPEGVGFRYETGGMMEALRVLTADRIREFHKEMYQPKNLCLVIIGEIEHDELLKILDGFETSILNDIPEPSTPWRRPWIDSKPVPPISKSVVETVEFPEQDESTGEISVVFLGPDCTDAKEMAVLETLGTFLAGSSVSILENQLVEIDDPYCTSVAWYVEERPQTLIWINLSSVATNRLAEAEKKLFEVLENTLNEPLDFAYMQECLKRTKRQKKFNVESSGYYFSSPVILDFLFGKRDGSTLKNLETLAVFDELEKWGEADWKAFLRKWVVENNHVSILARPSAKLATKIEGDEKKRTAAQIEKLGEEGLKQLQKKLDEAKAENDREIPPELLGKFEVPGVESIHFIETTTAKAGFAVKDGKPENDIQKILDKDTADIPLYLHFEHVPSNFVHVNVLISTASVPIELRPLLAVYLENFFNTPVVRDGVRQEFEEVVVQLEKDTVNYTITSGSVFDAPEHIRIRFQVEPDKYDITIKWLRELLWESIFDKKRLATTVTKLKADIPEEKRSGSNMAWSVNTMVSYSRESIGRAQDTLVKALYLKRINSLLEEKPDEAIAQFEEFRKSLCTLENMRILVIADVNKLKNPVSAWKELVIKRGHNGQLAPITRRKERLTPEGQKPGNVAHIIPLPTIDSSFSVHVALGPDNMGHPKLPAMLLAIAYLDAVEGPLWRAVRGTGLAYGTGFSKNVDAGQLQFSVYRSPDAYKAWAASKKVVTDHIDGTVEFDKFSLEGALSSIVVSFADSEPSMATAGTVSFINQVVYGQPKDYNKQLLKKVRAVTVDDIKAVLKEVILPVFEPETSNTVVVTAPVKTESIKSAFEKEKFNVKVNPLSFFQDDYGLKYGLKPGEEDGEEEEEDDDDEDDDDEEDSEESEEDDE
ncbi:hypothetical protein RUND412_009713 [Rhizina undulata]